MNKVSVFSNLCQCVNNKVYKPMLFLCSHQPLNCTSKLSSYPPIHVLLTFNYTMHLSFSYSNFLFFFYRFIGLCLLQNELFPLFLSRHVLKSILGRTVRFHDLAFFDPVIYESLRQLVVDAETKESSNSLFSALDLTFRYTMSM